MSEGKSFHAPATGKARRPAVEVWQTTTTKQTIRGRGPKSTTVTAVRPLACTYTIKIL